jgi:hypothetical protein
LVGLFVRRSTRRGRTNTPLPPTIARTEPPRTAVGTERFAAATGAAPSAGVPAVRGLTADRSSAACWSAGLGKQLRALAESPRTRPLQAVIEFRPPLLSPKPERRPGCAPTASRAVRARLGRLALSSRAVQTGRFPYRVGAAAGGLAPGRVLSTQRCFHRRRLPWRRRARALPIAAPRSRLALCSADGRRRTFEIKGKCPPWPAAAADSPSPMDEREAETRIGPQVSRAGGLVKQNRSRYLSMRCVGWLVCAWLAPRRRRE